MKIYSSTLVHGPQTVPGVLRGSEIQTAKATSSLAEVDQLDISPAGELASRSLEESRREDRVAEIRAAIQAGTYETDDKLSVALDRLLDELG